MCVGIFHHIYSECLLNKLNFPFILIEAHYVKSKHLDFDMKPATKEKNFQEKSWRRFILI